MRCLLDALSIIGTVIVSLDALDYWYFGVVGIIGDATPYRRSDITVTYCTDLKPVTYRACHI